MLKRDVGLVLFGERMVLVILMIWIISVPRWIKRCPRGQRGGLVTWDCSASNKLHFMLHVELTTFSSSSAHIWKSHSLGLLSPASNPFTDSNFNLNEHCLQFVIDAETNAGCPIYSAHLSVFIAGKIRGLMRRALKNHYPSQNKQ